MPNALTATGLTTATRSELLAQYIASYQAIYGADINLNSDTPDGQLLNIFIQSVLDLEDLIVQVYNSFDPDNAIGVVLDQRVAFNGIQRQGGTFTTTNVTIISSQSVNLYGLDQTVQPVYTVADNAGNQWQLIATQLGVAPGTNVFLFQAAHPGQMLTVPNTITVPVTVVIGVTSVNNPTTYATLGINEESDAALRIRRQKSVSLQSQGFFQGLLAALENINGISSAFIIENDSDGTDGNGIPGHSIWVIVSGSPNVSLSAAYNSATTYQYGNIASSAGVNYISVANNNTGNLVSNPLFWAIYNPIAEAIYNYRNAGCGMYNSGDSASQSYTVTQIDGSAFTVYWDGVVSQTLYTKFTAESLDGLNPPNIAGIQSYLVTNLTPSVFGEVNINQLSTLVQIADPNTLAISSGFSKTSASTGFLNTQVPDAKNKQFTVSSANIIILPIIMACPNGKPVFTLESDGAYQVTNTTVNCASGGATIQFAPVGGHGSYTYAMVSGSGSINSSTGLYTSSSAGTDHAHVTDSLGNVGTVTITVI